MTKIKSKLLTLLLVVCLIIPCMFALVGCGNKINYTEVNDLAELKAALVNDINDDVIKLMADIDLKTANDNQALVIDSGKNTIDLNGHTLTGVDNGTNSWHAINLKGADTELVIKDSSKDNTGSIIGRCYGVQISRGAKLTVESGKFVCTQNGTFDQLFVIYGGELVINGGDFTSTNDVVYGSSYKWNDVEYANEITINGGKFTSTKATDDNTGSLFIFEKGEFGIEKTQTVKINAGTFNKGNLEYIVSYDEFVDFTNGANISAENIQAPAAE